ncbi:MAG: chain-length determining protein [Aquabacterium sp.]|uniref:chain-length determining protein n=1 Tax=Aquabacterium sp. TaxID=1872578 RepID=UPI0027233CEA|nr:chain-length determining protein [Aquabacterium sp.]MDO9005541.1 chain-length determining protein [Aquabacterium sp.]
MNSPATKPGLPSVLRQHALLAGTCIAVLLAAVYWAAIASDRYISEAHVIIQSTDMASSQGSGLASMLGGGVGIPTEQLLLRDYLLSVDMLKNLDAKLNLRGHYSDPAHDVLSRLWFKDATLEKFYDYYRTRISVELDEYAGILVIKAQGYDPGTAHAIATLLVDEGEQFMDGLARNLAQEQVNFLNKDIQKTREHLLQAREALLSFQNKYGLVSPQGTTANIAGTINRMETQLNDLQTSRSAMLGYLMPNSANIVELNLQIDALEKQIASEKARLTSTKGKTLNSTVEAYQRLEMNATFAQDVYNAALTALEQGRIQASRTLKKMSVLQAPTLPEYAVEPRRLYNCVAFTVLTLILAGIAHLLAAIIRDHKD